MSPRDLNNPKGNKLSQEAQNAADFELGALENLKANPLSQELDSILGKKEKKKANFQSTNNFASSGEEEELPEMSLNMMGEEFSLEDSFAGGDESLDLNLGGEEDFQLSDLELGGDSAGLELNDDGAGALDPGGHSDDAPGLGDLDLGNMDDLSLDAGGASAVDISLGDDLPPEFSSPALDLGSLGDEEESLAPESELSDEAKEKLREIDAILDGSSKIDIRVPTEGIVGLEDLSPANSGGAFELSDNDLDQPLVSEDMNLDDLHFAEEAPEEKISAKAEEKSEEKPRRKKKEAKEQNFGDDLKEISGAYSGELERMQATLANLRADREELLNKIQNLEEDKMMHNRQTLSLRAELDEKKIELSIIRRKLNDEVSELKDKLRIHEERRLIMEEKYRTLLQELDKAGQRNKLDVKKVQLRERELEQRLELLKSDAEMQIRNRDLKILELKRKVDAMEFDMESITTQEKRSVESRFELEDKLDKAIKTLRNAITVLEDENDKGALDILKKDIDM